MKLSFFGAGYVGLVTAACFAELGNEVMACDVDEAKISRLRGGEIPIYEPGLKDIVVRNAKEGRLQFTTDPAEAARFGEMLFVAVGTPSNEDGTPDMKYVYAVADIIGDNLEGDKKIVVMKSTVPVGTSADIRRRIAEKLAARGKNMEFEVVSNPEFLKEGDAIADFTHPDRIVVGTEKDWARKKMSELYEPITKPGHPVFFMDNASAEMAKYAANTFLAARISLMNQLAHIAETLDADIEEVRRSLAADQRIGRHFLYPGVGYGGSCFPKDVQALAATAAKAGVDAELIRAIESVNAGQRTRFTAKIKEGLGGVQGKKLAVWGLAFKPKTDDMRQAPAKDIVEALLADGAIISAYDPVAMEEAKKIFGTKITYAPDMYSALDGAEALVIITEWGQFREPDFGKISAALKNKTIFDGRNIYEPARMAEFGFRYFGIGRRS